MCCLVHYYKHQANLTQSRMKKLLTPRCPQMPFLTQHLSCPASAESHPFLSLQFGLLSLNFYALWLSYAYLLNSMNGILLYRSVSSLSPSARLWDLCVLHAASVLPFHSCMVSFLTAKWWNRLRIQRWGIVSIKYQVWVFTKQKVLHRLLLLRGNKEKMRMREWKRKKEGNTSIWLFKEKSLEKYAMFNLRSVSGCMVLHEVYLYI